MILVLKIILSREGLADIDENVRERNSKPKRKALTEVNSKNIIENSFGRGNQTITG